MLLNCFGVYRHEFVHNPQKIISCCFTFKVTCLISSTITNEKKTLSTANKNKSCAKCMFYHDTAFDLSRNWMFKVINGIWSVEHLYILICSDLWYSYHSSIYRANKNYEKSKMSSRTCITILYSDKHNITPPPPQKKKKKSWKITPSCM